MSDPGLERENAEYLSALEAALRALVMVEPLVNDREDYWRCAYCEADKPLYGPEGAAPFVHEAGCSWLTARSLLLVLESEAP